MVRTLSTMLELGTRMPEFNLPNLDGEMVGPQDFGGRPALLVMFICNHCPFVKHIQRGLAQFCKEYQKKGLGVLAVNSNDVRNHPDDSPVKMREEAAAAGYTFPYLYDETQEVATAFRAACTPDFFLFDKEGKLAYRGQFDDSRPENGVPVTGEDLRKAVDAVLAGRPVTGDQKPSIGCNIKWKPGNEPDYFGF